MKKLLAALFVALLMIGCGPSQETLDFIRQTKESGATELDLASKQISDLAPLAGLTNLKYLYLHNNNKITDLSPLKGLVNLKELYLHGNPIPDDQIEMLKKALPKCKIYF